jgi:hypothetical protein
VLRLSDREFGLIDGAARADGLAVGAWLGELATRAAESGHSTWCSDMSRAHVVGALVRLRADLSHTLRVLELAVADPANRSAAAGVSVEVAKLVRATLARLDAMVDEAVDDTA